MKTGYCLNSFRKLKNKTKKILLIIDKLKKHYTFQQQRKDVLVLFSEREDIQTGLKMTIIVLNVLWWVLTLPSIPFKWCIKKSNHGYGFGTYYCF